MTHIVLAVMISGLLPIVCAGLAKWGFRNFDNRHPRAWLAGQEGWRARANAAQQNSFEAFPFFAAGVVFALLAGTEPERILPVCWFFVAARVAYIGCYVADKALLRTLFWTAGMGATLRLFAFAV